MKQRQAYTALQLPGTPSRAFTKAKRGYKEVNGYAAYNGLSEAPSGSRTSLWQERERPDIVQVRAEAAQRQMDAEPIQDTMDMIARRGAVKAERARLQQRQKESK